MLARAVRLVDGHAVVNPHDASTRPGNTPVRDRPVLLFDGACHLCHGAVRFVLRHERAPRVLFAALQSDTGHALLRDLDLPPGILDSMVLFEDGRVFTRSEAALRLARHLRIPWSWGRALLRLPRACRDPLYDWIARHRYRWFGRADEVCLVPEPTVQERFLR